MGKVLYKHAIGNIPCDRSRASAHVHVASQAITAIDGVKALYLFARSQIVTYVFGIETGRVLQNVTPEPTSTQAKQWCGIVFEAEFRSKPQTEPDDHLAGDL